MIFPKFIIETNEGGDYIVIGTTTYHKQLAFDLTKVKGGGWWVLNNGTSTFTLHGASTDFGRAKFEDIQKCIQNKRVFTSYTLDNNLTDDHKFNYRNRYGEIQEF